MMFYYNKGNFTKAVIWGEINAEAVKRKAGDQDTLYGAAIGDLGVFYFSSGNYIAAKPLYLKSADIFKLYYGEKNQQYATSLNNLARLYNVIGDLSSSESLYLKSLKIYKELVGEQSSDFARTLDNLAVLYSEGQKYSLCEKMFIQALDIRKKILGKEHWEFAFSLNNLASLYTFLGNYAAAEPLFDEAIPILKKQLGKKHPDYATALGNLSIVNLNLKNYIKAEPLAKEDCEIKKEIFGEESQAYALALDNLAGLYYEMRKGIVSEQLYKKAIAIRKKILGTGHLDYAASLLGLAFYYTSTQDYIIADSLYKEALSIRKQKLGEKNQSYQQVLKYQADLYILLKKYFEANDVILKILPEEKKGLINKLDFLTEKELLEYLRQREPAFILPYALLWNYKTPELIQAAYNSRLFFKGVTIQNTNGLNKEISLSKDSLLIKLWKDYKINKSILNRVLTQPVTTRTLNIDSFNIIVNQQEKELLQQSADYRNMKHKLNITWQDVRNNLKKNEAAIEFVGFRYGPSDTMLYTAAMLIRPNDTVPIFINLFEEIELKTALTNFAYKAAVLKSGAKKKLNVVKTQKTSLYDLVWLPLEPYLRKTTTIYFAPNGMLQHLAFAAIPYKKDSFLCDKYNLIQLTSTRQLAIKDSNTQAPTSIALFGGINYNKQNTDTTIAVPADPYAFVYRQNRSAGVDSFSYLPGTLQEVEDIKRKMELQQKKVSIYSGIMATEDAFRNIGGTSSPTVIHFATHSFNIPTPTTQNKFNNSYKFSDNPLLRSGLVLAGGNKGWKGKSNFDEDDGILTALEISSVSLPNTQLAVLSACETATGELRGSEGIFGLQRAFKLAGVNYIMASLWQVPDKETGIFMNLFYANWLAGKSIRQAFTITQQVMRKKYAPYYWAAFTLVQ
ncbi:MAG: CHAT domain-containing protein [Chitinophagaceae bacterium]